jgi:hypothetical protein
MYLGDTFGITNGIVAGSAQVAVHILHGKNGQTSISGCAITDYAVNPNLGNYTTFVVCHQKITFG